MNKHYNSGLVIGRFQPLHKGHEMIINTALSFCDKVYIYIGSAQISRCENNPYNYEERKHMIELAFPKAIKQGRIIIKPLYDMGYGNCTTWGQYVLDVFKNDNNILPDLYLTGCEKERSSWFSNEIAPNMDELRLTRHNIKISGTECREALKLDKNNILKENISYNVLRYIKKLCIV